MRITFMLNVLGTVGGVRVVLEYAHFLQKRHHEVCVVYPVVTIPPRVRFNIMDTLPVVRSSLSGLRRLIEKDSGPLFKTDASLVKIPFVHPRFLKLVDRSIPDGDVIIATSWETAYTVNKLNERKGEKFYFIQSYEIWDIWDNLKCWEAARKVKKGGERCSLAMAEIIPSKKNLKEVKELVDRSFKLPLRKIVISDWLRQLVEEKFGERVEGVIPNGVNFDIFYKKSDRREQAGRIKILMAYRRGLYRGFNDGLEAFRLIKARHPDAHFAVFGQLGKKELRKMPEWVEVHNFQSDAQLKVLYNQAHIFVAPSWMEGFGLPPMEAMACGCAVVMTDSGGFSDYLEDGKTASLVPIQNPVALARSVCGLIEDAHELRRMAENGCGFVRQFTWERAAKELEVTLEN